MNVVNHLTKYHDYFDYPDPEYMPQRRDIPYRLLMSKKLINDRLFKLHFNHRAIVSELSNFGNFNIFQIRFRIPRHIKVIIFNYYKQLLISDEKNINDETEELIEDLIEINELLAHCSFC